MGTMRLKLLLLSVFLVTAGNLFAQPLDVTGTVTDQEGIALPGANITIKGTTTGVVTNIDGQYWINADRGDVLLCSFIGYLDEEVTVGEATVIDVVLSESVESLEEVVVIGYGQQQKVTVTGAISTVQSEEILRSPSASVVNSLAGKITGLATVQYSGEPGADEAQLYVRGVASLSEDRSSPLIIVDGVERSFSQMDPNEIESISVLKDASATAVYGVKGANGVIIVTTKRGNEGPARISLNLSTGLQVPSRLMEFADSYTYSQMYSEAQMNDGVDPAELKFGEHVQEAFRTGSDPLVFPDIDWTEYVMKPYAMQNAANMNIRGGSKKVKYFVSLGYLNQDGLFKTFDSEYDYNYSFNRYNYRTNLDVDLTPTTKIGITLGGRVGVKNEPLNASSNNFFRNISWSVPYSGAGIVDGKYIRSNQDYIPGPKKDGLNEFYGKGFNNRTRNDLNFDIDLRQKLDMLVPGLSFRTKIAFNSYYIHTKTRKSSVANYEPYYMAHLDPDSPYYTKYDSIPDDKTLVYRKNGSDGNLGYTESADKGRNQYMEAGLEYVRKFGDHKVTGLVLYNQRKVYYPKNYSYIPAGLVGLVGRATYNYKTKYLADLNLGYNGSENFAPGKRFGFFPAGSIGWIVTEEQFMPEIPFLGYLKLRASYGMVGNDRLGDVRFLYLPDSYNPNTGGYNFGTDVPSNQPGAAENRIGNPDVTWETAVKQNYGFDMKLFGNRLTLNYDYFYEHRDDILWTRETAPGFVAYAMPAENIGEVENRGFEVQLSWRHQVMQNMSYWINVNMSHARNTILYMDEIPQNEDYLYRTGHPVNQPFGYLFRGFYNPGDDNSDLVFPYPGLQPGDMTYVDLNNDGVIDADDQMAIGYPEYPMYSYGLNMGFSFRGFDVAMHWVGADQVSRMLDETYRVAFGQTLDRSLMQYMADDRWTPETAGVAVFPRMTLSGSENNKKDSDFWLRNASYIRLKNVEIGYDFRGKVLKRLGVKTMRIYANGYNLITIDNLKVADPEAKTGRYPKYPLVKIYNLGVKMNF